MVVYEKIRFMSTVVINNWTSVTQQRNTVNQMKSVYCLVFHFSGVNLSQFVQRMTQQEFLVENSMEIDIRLTFCNWYTQMYHIRWRWRHMILLPRNCFRNLIKKIQYGSLTLTSSLWLIFIYLFIHLCIPYQIFRVLVYSR